MTRLQWHSTTATTNAIYRPTCRSESPATFLHCRLNQRFTIPDFNSRFQFKISMREGRRAMAAPPPSQHCPQRSRGGERGRERKGKGAGGRGTEFPVVGCCSGCSRDARDAREAGPATNFVQVGCWGDGGYLEVTWRRRGWLARNRGVVTGQRHIDHALVTKHRL